MKSRGHVRLLLFFTGLAVSGSLLGVLGLDYAEDARGRIWAVVLAVSLTCALGFGGVLFHRVKVLKARWRETEEYLARIRRESEKYFSILEGAADMLVLVDPRETSVLEINAMARSKLGLARPALERAPGEVASSRLGDVFVAEDRERFQVAVRAAAAGQGPAASLEELRLSDASGRTLVVDARLAAIVLEDRKVIQVALRDLTAQKQIERHLQIHERLSSVGLLTAGVAHEINNPLEAIGNYLALIEKPNLAPEQRTRYVEAVRHGFARIREIVRDLLQFARPVQGLGEADLSEVVARALELAAFSERTRGVSIAVEGLDRPLLVVGDAGRLEQVVVNLVINAATAAGANGHVRLSAQRAVRAKDATPVVALRVEDDGPGISTADLERIFDPFFTTTGGTGLGLSVSYGIVSAHGGTLAAENTSSGGARFTVELPLRRAAVASAVVEDRAP